MNMEIALFMAHLCLIVPALYDYPDVSSGNVPKLEIFLVLLFAVESRTQITISKVMPALSTTQHLFWSLL